MTPRQFWDSRPREEVAKMCDDAGTTLKNFRNIVYGGHVGPKLAERITEASGGLMSELEILYPGRYQ